MHRAPMTMMIMEDGRTVGAAGQLHTRPQPELNLERDWLLAA